MSRGLNRTEILGHLGSDPDLNYTGDGTAVANFSVATNAYDRDEPEWHNCTAWDELAEIVNEHLAKGERVYVEGPLRTREWEDSDGRTRYSTEIHADNVIFLGSDQAGGRRQANGEAQGPPQKQPAGAEDQGQFEPDDQLPF